MNAYADTSFLVSLYAPDANSEAVAKRAARASLPFVLTSFGELELTNALHLRVFRKELRSTEVKTALGAFRHDVENGVFLLKPMPSTAFQKALQIVGRHTAQLGSRTLDVLHVASALVLGVDRFYTMDANQLRLARSEGLRLG